MNDTPMRNEIRNDTNDFVGMTVIRMKLEMTLIQMTLVGMTLIKMTLVKMPLIRMIFEWMAQIQMTLV